MVISRTANIAFNMKHPEEMLAFYEKLGMKRAFTKTYADYLTAIRVKKDSLPPEYQAVLEEQFIKPYLGRETEPWIEFLEFGDHQFLALNYCENAKDHEGRPDAYWGYQHFALEVPDIHAAYEQLVHDGIMPGTGIVRGRHADHAEYGFVLSDPDGNIVEVVQYAEDEAFGIC